MGYFAKKISTMKRAEKKFTAVIIGRGFAGLTSAVELARAGLENIALIYDELEQRSASSVAQGISAVKGILEADAELFELKLAGHRGFEAWLSGIETMIGRARPPGVWISGVAEKFTTLQSFRKDFGRIYRGDFIGAKNVVLSYEGKDNFAQARYPGDFWIDSNYLLSLLTEAALALGVHLIPGKVKSIEPNSGHSVIEIGSQTLIAEFTIVAAGPRSLELIPRETADAFDDFFGVPGFTFSSETSGEKRCEVKGTASFVSSHGKAFWGSTSESAAPLSLVLAESKKRSSDINVKLAHELAKKITADLSALTNISTCWGIRVRAKGRLPVVRQIHAGGNIWFNTGYYKSGVILAWLFAGRLAAQVAESIKIAARREISSH
jgi:glycine/D-amino acid oxidase-like deaminating enzyme